MESKNVIAAIALSTAVIVLYSLFFLPEQKSNNQNIADNAKVEQSSDAPSLEQKETLVSISRDEALTQSERIQFENNNIIGSISLKGASIDDLTFKKYKVNLEEDKRVTLLAPRNIKEGYLMNGKLVRSDISSELGYIKRTRSNKNLNENYGWNFIDSNTSLIIDAIKL